MFKTSEIKTIPQQGLNFGAIYTSSYPRCLAPFVFSFIREKLRKKCLDAVTWKPPQPDHCHFQQQHRNQDLSNRVHARLESNSGDARNSISKLILQ